MDDTGDVETIVQSARASRGLKPQVVRYLKLGQGGAWLDACLEQGLIALGHQEADHPLCLRGDWDAVRTGLIAAGRSATKATDFIREVRDFYTLGSDCLWITFGRGRLWWAFAEPEVHMSGPDQPGVRHRRVIGQWSDQDVDGKVLTIDSLSSRLTQVAAYRQTLCRVGAEDYLLRRLNAQPEPVVARALAASVELEGAAQEIIQALHWADFEVLVDLIFAQGGWRRISVLGGAQADADLILEQAITGERAFVQIKSTASRAVFDDYLSRFQSQTQFDRMFFVCHSSDGLEAPAGADRPVYVWSGRELAQRAVRCGLMDWLMARAS